MTSVKSVCQIALSVWWCLEGLCVYKGNIYVYKGIILFYLFNVV